MKTITDKELLQEWDYAKNAEIGITPDNVVGRDQIWWKCKTCNHSWQMSVYYRTYYKFGCPVCRKKGKRVIEGVDDLATKFPELLQEWDYEKNDKLGIKPNEILYGSGKQVWWKCPKCHYEWQNTVNNRTKVSPRHRKGAGCPCCSGRVLVQGINDLQTTRPDLMQKWYFERNDMMGLKPTDVTQGMPNKAWWKCDECGTIEYIVVASKAKGLACKTCAEMKRKALRFPELRAEWNYERNDAEGIYLDRVTVTDKVWWKCAKGHEWKALLSNRTRTDKSRGCPICKGFKAEAGYNDLATKNPELLDEWDFTKNDAKGLNPTGVVSGSARKVWWKCKYCGFEWESKISNRTKLHTGCPECAKLDRLMHRY